jgi:hypothetical protein
MGYSFEYELAMPGDNLKELDKGKSNKTQNYQKGKK